MKVEIGDRVRFLNSVGGGKVVKIDGTIVHVEDEDGFETPVLMKECVIVEKKNSQAELAGTKPNIERPIQNPIIDEPIVRTVVADQLPPFEETPEGEKLNIVLAFEAHDLKNLSETNWDAYLVNDSNYWLFYAFLSKDDDSDRWTLRNSGTVEPGIQLFIEEITKETVGKMKNVCIQYLAFKTDREFDLKKPSTVELKIDVTKFFKLHCFKENIYFDTNVIAFDIVSDDKPLNSEEEAQLDMNNMLAAKINKDMSVLKSKRVVKHEKKGRDEQNEVDLHIEELVDNTRGMSPADILNRQIDEFRAVMDANLKNKGKKIIFIHGKGEGVLRNAIIKELTHRYKGVHQVQDASFREYGFGATQVTIR